VLDPDILILDEVLSVGDSAFRTKSRARIEELMARSRLIVIVSHGTAFLRSICTHCLWLEQGRVRAFGEAGEILDAYQAAMGVSDSDLSESEV
jgi:ABC-type polysaccharide/polyol phosphate transport system ATPase subunit